MQYQKVKSVGKLFKTKGESLDNTISTTLETCAKMVGATLGPGGMNVIIERQEQGMPPFLTKDGVTVFKNLGFQDSTAHVVMELARDAATRTASEAGDGTTTATVLANAFYKCVSAYCKANPKVSPQRVVRDLEKCFKTILEPLIRKMSVSLNMNSPEADNQLKAVAAVSANGDSDLAEAVLQCFKLVGDEGNVTIVEYNGSSRYEVERIDGYGVGIGFEDCCGPFYQKFINNTGSQSVVLDNPLFILYHGRINDVAVLAPLFEKIIEASQGKVPNIVVMANGFSEVVLAQFGTNFTSPNKNICVYPFLVPMSPMKTGQYDFLMDMAALSGSKVFDALERPIEISNPLDIGTSIEKFEASRWRSNIVVNMDLETEERIFQRTDEIDKQLSSIASSDLDKQLLRERIGKLTGGIAKLKVIGSSTGELREKRDRAEDAICAVRGAIKHGTLPAGGWTFLKLISVLTNSTNPVESVIVVNALKEPINLLFKNAGYSVEETSNIIDQLNKDLDSKTTFNILEGKMVDAYKEGLLDSTPAVLEALKNAISIASQLGTNGGLIVFGRDSELERREAREVNDFIRDSNMMDNEPITERP